MLSTQKTNEVKTLSDMPSTPHFYVLTDEQYYSYEDDQREGRYAVTKTKTKYVWFYDRASFDDYILRLTNAGKPFKAGYCTPAEIKVSISSIFTGEIK